MTILSNTFAVAVGTFVVAWTGIAFTGEARAEQPKPRTFQVEIKYDASQPAETIYARINEQAASACRRQALRGQPSFPLSHRKSVRVCADDLVGKAVTQIGKSDLMALHTGAAQARQVATR